MSTNSNFDTAKAEAFAGQFLNAMNYASMCLMASIGHRTGLFDVMRGMPQAVVHSGHWPPATDRKTHAPRHARLALS